GVTFGATAAGIKLSRKPDLALAVMPEGASAAALFTRNRVVAAPLVVGREHLAATHGRVRALLVNSGNANCATGEDGLRACRHICAEVAGLLGIRAAEVFPSSTGVIGVPLPAARIQRALPRLIAAPRATRGAALAFARAVLTTDTRLKVAGAAFRSRQETVSLLGIAKGSGMIHPQMATMLVYLFTDVAATPGQLRPLLAEAAEDSFNSVSVDGDTSTNDTVLLLATGASGIALKSSGVRGRFATALRQVCQSLADQIVRDGEGARCL